MNVQFRDVIVVSPSGELILVVNAIPYVYPVCKQPLPYACSIRGCGWKRHPRVLQKLGLRSMIIVQSWFLAWIKTQKRHISDPRMDSRQKQSTTWAAGPEIRIASLSHQRKTGECAVRATESQDWIYSSQLIMLQDHLGTA